MSETDMPMTRKVINALRLELPEEVANDALPLLHSIVDAYESAEAQIAALTQRAEQAERERDEAIAGYDRSPVSAKACPGCVYENGRFIRHCGLHERFTAAESELKRLEKFKAYTHQRLDELGAPESVPESPHTAAGCRVGGRFDWVRDLIAGEVACVREAEDDRIAAESREKRLREGIEALKVDIHTPIDLYERLGPTWTSRDSGQEYYDASYVLDKMAELEASVDALLSQPSDGKEADGGK